MPETQPTSFRAATTAQFIQQLDGRLELVVVQVNAFLITSVDLDNKELILQMALSAEN